ncbi:MAG: class I SAM-dependent methyltransferase [Candidatus Methanoperedens sp.]|nr:class I SAM-dependent methyltransferase [Candidatus Methanoperedens sp.]
MEGSKVTWYNDLTLKALKKIAKATYIIPRLSFEARLIEYQFIYSNIRSDKKLRILDVGCAGTKLPIKLAKTGHEVYGIDACPYHNQDFYFIQSSLEHLPFDNDFFDIVSAVSTIEHVGLGRYGDPISPNGDKKAMEELKRIVKPGGKIILTIPCGIDTICYSRDRVPLHRVYSPHSLNELLSGLRILELSYIVKRTNIWSPASVSEAEVIAENTKSEFVGMTSIALINAQKEKQ